MVMCQPKFVKSKSTTLSGIGFAVLYGVLSGGAALKKEQKLWTRDFIAVCLSNFFIFMTFYILAVTLPLFVKGELHGGDQDVGLVMTILVISAVVFRPIAGKWLDEFNRKKILILSLILFLVCTCLYAGVSNLYLLLALRFMHGIGYGIAATATGAIAIDFVPEKRKGEGIAYFSLFMSLAMVVGPFLGLIVMEHFNQLILFVLCIVFSSFSLICGIIIKSDKPVPKKKAEPSAGWKKYIEPGAIPISLAGSIVAFSYSSITPFVAVYAQNIGMSSYASYFFIVFAAMIILSRPITGRIFDKFGEHVLIYPGLFLFTAGTIGLSLVHTPALFLAAGSVIGLGFGALFPSFLAIAVQSSPSIRRGTATGTFFMVFDAGYCVGSYVLGTVAAQTDFHTMYLIAGISVAGTVIIYYALHHRRIKFKHVQAVLDEAKT